MQQEHNEQVALFKMAASLETQYPELSLLFAVPNGGKRISHKDKNGRYYSPAGQWLVAEGLRKGVPDVWLPIMRNGHPGVVIEMKSEKGRLRPEQIEWLHKLREQGWITEVCRSWVDAINILMEYLIGDKWNEIE